MFRVGMNMNLYLAAGCAFEHDLRDAEVIASDALQQWRLSLGQMLFQILQIHAYNNIYKLLNQLLHQDVEAEIIEIT